MKNQKMLFQIFIMIFLASGAWAADCTHPDGTGHSGGAVSWTDSPLLPGTAIRSIHMNEIRSNIDLKRVACGLFPVSWREPIVGFYTPIKKQHIDELRTEANQLISDSAAVMHTSRSPATFTDASITRGVTPVKAVHIAEIRAAVDSVNCAPSPTVEGLRRFAGNERLAPARFDVPVWNLYKAWLIAQFANMGADISSYDFTAMAAQFNATSSACRNFGDDTTTKTYSVSGMSVQFTSQWEGNEWLLPGGCTVTLIGHISGTLNGWICR